MLHGIATTTAKLEPNRPGSYGPIRRRVQDACLRLAALSPSTAAEVRATLRRRRQLPEVCACLSRASLRDWAAFVYGLLPGVGTDEEEEEDNEEEGAATMHEWFWEWVAGLEDGSRSDAAEEVEEDELEEEDGGGGPGRGRDAAEARRLLLAPTLPELVDAVWEGNDGGNDDDGLGPVPLLKATCALLAYAGAALPWAALSPAWESAGRVLNAPDPPASVALLALLASVILGSHAAERGLALEAVAGRLVEAAELAVGGGGGAEGAERGEGEGWRVGVLRLLLWLGSAAKVEEVERLCCGMVLHNIGLGGEGDGAGEASGGEGRESVRDEESSDEESGDEGEAMAVDGEPQQQQPPQQQDEAGGIVVGPAQLHHLRSFLKALADSAVAARAGSNGGGGTRGGGGGPMDACSERALVGAVLRLRLSLACPAEFVGTDGPISSAITPLSCLHELLVQGLPERQGLDLHDTVLRLLQAPAPPGATVLDPWALPLAMAYAAATVPDEGAGAKAEGGASAHRHHPLLPKDIHALIAPAVRVVMAQHPSGAAHAPFVHASPASALLSHACPRRTSLSSSSSLFRRRRGQQTRGEQQQEQQRFAVFVGLVALLYAMARERRAQERQGPFPQPFDYQLDAYPLPALLALASRYGDSSESGAAAAGCWTQLHNKLLALALDIFPDLFSPAALALSSSDGSGAMVHEHKNEELETAAVLGELKAALLQASVPCDNDGQEAEGLMERAQQQNVVLRDLSTRWLNLRRRSRNPLALEHRTLRAFLRAAAYGDASLLPPSRRQGAQEPLLVFRAMRWAFGVPALLRILLPLLDGLLRASRVEAAQATAAAMWKAELPLAIASRNGGSQPQQRQQHHQQHQLHDSRGRPPSRPPSPVSAAAATASVLMCAEEGRRLLRLQDAIVAKCLLSAAATAAATSTEAHQEICGFLQHALAANPPALCLLVQRGLSATDMALLLDGVPALLACRSVLGTLARGSSLVARAHVLAFLAEFGRRWPVEEALQAARDGIGAVLDHHLRPVGLQVCQAEGEDVMSAVESMCQSILTLARHVFPALAPLALEATRRALGEKEVQELRGFGGHGEGGGKGRRRGGGGGGGDGGGFARVPALLEMLAKNLAQPHVQ